jgi:peptidoglycan/xylan/chitin deacetylase (PgdA/CDA1 family)
VFSPTHRVLKRQIKLLISLTVWSVDQLHAAVRRVAGFPPPSRTVILYYHAVPSAQRALFAVQMDMLRRTAIPIPADLRLHSTRPGLHVAVTFDDGFASVVDNALPELKSRQIPFTVFFPTGSWNSRPCWIHRPDHPSWNERVLSEDELLALADEPLATIASHSISHPNFLKLDHATADREFRESRKALELLLHRPIDLFSFPHGAHDEARLRQARDAGYAGIYTVEPELVTPAGARFVAGRIATNPDDPPLEFRLKMSGAYRWQAWFRRSTTSGFQ